MKAGIVNQMENDSVATLTDEATLTVYLTDLILEVVKRRERPIKASVLARDLAAPLSKLFQEETEDLIEGLQESVQERLGELEQELDIELAGRFALDIEGLQSLGLGEVEG
jgi:hypothetical protein